MDFTAESVYHDGYRAACQDVLHTLSEQLGFGLWMVTQVAGDDWVMLGTVDRGYGVHPGTVLSWADSYCSRMVQGKGPKFAMNSTLVEAYAQSPIHKQLTIQSYVGLPLQNSEGELLGTLCAIDPEPCTKDIERQLPFVELAASLLSKILTSSLELQALGREKDRWRLSAMRDEETGLLSRLGWDHIVQRENMYALIDGLPVSALLIWLPESTSPETVTQIARFLNENLDAPETPTAKIGDYTFGVLLCGHARREAERRQASLMNSLKDEGLKANVELAAWNGEATVLDVLAKFEGLIQNAA